MAVFVELYMQSNIEKFNYYVGCIFVLLYDKFSCRNKLIFLNWLMVNAVRKLYRNTVH